MKLMKRGREKLQQGTLCEVGSKQTGISICDSRVCPTINSQYYFVAKEEKAVRNPSGFLVYFCLGRSSSIS